jgi:heterodisulfide reductase subunit A
VENVFAGGDVVTGPATVIDALAAGKKASISIDKYFKGEDLTVGREGEGPQENTLEMDTSGLKIWHTNELSCIKKKGRLKIPTQRVEVRKGVFKEVERGLTEEEAIEEASRCINCPGCCECLSCVAACDRKAIDHNMKDWFEEIEVGAIVVATGFDLMPRREIKEFDLDLDIIEGIQFERILCPGGPTAGRVERISDGKIPKEVVFISCVGSRDPEHGVPYCSRVCCMYLAKQALLYKHAPNIAGREDCQAYVFYMDQRTTGKKYEEFVRRAIEEDGVIYLRGRVSRVFRQGDKLIVWGADTLTGKRVEIAADLVVLGTAMIPHPDTKNLAKKLGILTDEYGFIVEAHPKLRPVETTVPGIYLAGTAQGPKDIPDSVAQASGAAAKVLTLFSKDEVILEKLELEKVAA